MCDFNNGNATEKISNDITGQDFNTCDYDSDDSVRDKDYNPHESDISSDSGMESKQSNNRKLQRNKKTYLAQKSYVPHTHIPPTHAVFDIPHDKVLHTSRRNSFNNIHTLQPEQTIGRKRRNTIDVGMVQLLSTDNRITSHSVEQVETSKHQNRKKHNSSIIQRKIDAQNKRILKHSIQPGCDEKCIKKCTTQVSEEDRKEINKNY